jgi:uncharacterized protein YecE (DUF72 family)
MTAIYAGTSGWAYSSWKPAFYPAGAKPADFLRHYAARLNSVEVNYTFRALPTAKLLAAWASAVPADFRFAMKASFAITHRKRLRNAQSELTEFLTALKPLEKSGQLGPLLFQLPPFLKCDLTLLSDFLPLLPKRFRSTFEFRHDSWFNEPVYDALRKANVALCLAESEKLAAPDVRTADFNYFRLRMEGYSPQALENVARRIKKYRQKGEVYVYFMHQEKPDGALHAEKLIESLACARK